MATRNPFDFSDMFKQFDPAEATRQFQTMFENSPFAKLDTTGFSDAQRKNIDALMQAQKVVMDGAQSIMQSQAEMLRAAMAEATETVQNMSTSNPGDIPKKNAEAIEKAFNQAVENFNEISEMVEGLYKDISTKVETQVRENLDELKTTLAKAAKD